LEKKVATKYSNTSDSEFAQQAIHSKSLSSKALNFDKQELQSRGSTFKKVAAAGGKQFVHRKSKFYY
jgi:hypothetical protein